LSSIEHFGGHKAAKKSMQEMARVTKLGGIVVVATEFVLNDVAGHHPEYFTKEDFERFIIRGSKDLKLIQPVNYRPPAQVYFDNKVKVHTTDVNRTRHHVVLTDGTFEWTSVLAFFVKKAAL
jgi:hypothetical protein